MHPGCLPLYREIYSCTHCAGAVSERSVKTFVQPGPLQTLPVSHFGNISKAKIWLIATNPKGSSRKDSNVGFLPSGFSGRTSLTKEQLADTFNHFSEYFERGIDDSFFDRWKKVLDGIKLTDEPQSFASGGICRVDLIKCPTVDAWGRVVRGPDKHLIYDCFSNDSSQRYLRRQIELHDPRVLIFSAGLGAPRYYLENCRDNRDLTLRQLWPESIKGVCSGIWSHNSRADRSTIKSGTSRVQRRLSIGLNSDSEIERAEPELIK